MSIFSAYVTETEFLTERDYKASLLEACKYGDVGVIRRLIPDKLDVQAMFEGTNNTPLHEVCCWESVEAVEALLELQADVNAQEREGRTPLALACSRQSLEVMQVLLKHGADPNVATRNGETPLGWASFYNKYSVAELLLRTHREGSDDGIDRSSCIKVNIDMKGREGRTPLHNACERGHIEVVKLLVGHKAYLRAVDEKGHTPLYKACSKRQDDVVDYLFQTNPRLALGDSSYPLCFSVENNNLVIVEMFLDVGMSANTRCKKRRTLLHLACKEGYYEMAKLLLTRGAKVDAKGVGGLTPLHWAAKAPRHQGIIELLLDNGADLYAKDDYGCMALGEDE
ncbi:hypothetical protein ACOMHN_066016 [Nucella lapillus]